MEFARDKLVRNDVPAGVELAIGAARSFELRPQVKTVDHLVERAPSVFALGDWAAGSSWS
jgi:hypothetical protein